MTIGVEFNTANFQIETLSLFATQTCLFVCHGEIIRNETKTADHAAGVSLRSARSLMSQL